MFEDKALRNSLQDLLQEEIEVAAVVSVEDEVVVIEEDVADSEAEEVEIGVDLRLEAAEDQEVVVEAAVVLGDVAAEVVVAEAPKLS